MGMPQDQFEKAQQLAEDANSTVSEIVRVSLIQHGENATDLIKNKKILEESSPSDIGEIVFTCSFDKKSKIRLYRHKKAFADLENLGKKSENEVMEFFSSSITDGSILNKGEIKTSDNGTIFICFRVNLLKVYCHFSPMQLTILSVC